MSFIRQLFGVMLLALGIGMMFSLFFWADYCSTGTISDPSSLDIYCLSLFSIPTVLIGFGLVVAGVIRYQREID